MKSTAKRMIITGAALALLLAPMTASAHDGHDGSAETEDHPTSTVSPNAGPSKTPRPDRVSHYEDQLRTQLRQQKQERENETETEVEGAKATLREKLDSGKQKVCENHKTTINRLMTAMNQRRQNAFDRISQVSDATQAYVTKNSLAVDNYSDLIAKVAAAKATAQAAMQTQQTVPSLDCTGDHPRADVADFKTKRADSIDAMKAYRDNVKALVQAVKTTADSSKEAA